MLALLAIAVLTPLLYIPGYLFAHALLGVAQPRDVLERHYERVVAGALLNGWLALTLAELGIFSAGLHLLLVALVCAACAVVAWRRGALWLPQAPLGIVSNRRINAQTLKRPNLRALIRHWDTIGFAAIGLLFALLIARPFEVVLGARDAGVYSNIGFAIAQNGGIVQHDALVQQLGADKRSEDPELREAAAQAETNFLGNQPASRFVATRLRLSGFLIWAGDLDAGRIVPQFLHLYPAWIALLASLLGLRGGLLATGLLGFLGVWSVGMLGRRLAGPWVGLLGALFLALNGVQVWFSRYSTSEACAQFLCFAALYSFAVMQEPGTNSREPDAAATDSRPVFAGLLAGVAAGQLALTRIDFFVLVAPLLLYLAYMALARRWSAALWALAGGLGAMLLQTLLHVIFISRAYFLDTLYARLQDKSAIVANLVYPLWTPELQRQFQEIPRSAPLRHPLRLPIEIGLLAFLVAAFVLLRRDGRPQRWFERLVLRYRRGLLRAGAALIVLLGVYAYFIRPQILTAQTLAAAPSCLAPAQVRAPTGACLALQGYIGAPIAVPEHPNQVAYLLDSLPGLLRGYPQAGSGLVLPVGSAGGMYELPAAGAVIDQVAAGETLQVLGRNQAGDWYLGTDPRNVTGWVSIANLALDNVRIGDLPEYPANVITRIVNPRDATSFSPGNPGESEKIGIAQANLVRLGWYLSPLGVLLGLAGFALWWLRGLNRASWLFLVASLISAVFFLRLAYGATDLTYIYILRRYVPMVYPAFSLAMAYAIVALARWRTKDQAPKTKERPTLPPLVFGLSSLVLVVALLGFFALTNRPLYQHVEYDGALSQIEGLIEQYGFGERDVLLFRGEGRDTPDLVVTPLKYAYGLDALAIRSDNPGKYASQLARYVRRWQEQGRQVYLVLGPNGAVELPGLRPTRLGPAALHLPEFQQLRDQKPRGVQQFRFDFEVYRLEPTEGAAPEQAAIAVDDYTAQVRGFYHPEQIGGQAIAWTDGDALLRLPWPRDGQPRTLTIQLSPGAARPATLGATQVCVSFLPEASFELKNLPFSGEQCVPLSGAALASYRFTLDPRSLPASNTGTFLLRIASPTWVPATSDPAQFDRRTLGVQFGGLEISEPE